MTRVLSIIHKMREGEATILQIDITPPSINEQNYVEPAVFWVTLKKGDSKVLIKLSTKEMAYLIKHLDVALNEALRKEQYLIAKSSERRKQLY